MLRSVAHESAQRQNASCAANHGWGLCSRQRAGAYLSHLSLIYPAEIKPLHLEKKKFIFAALNICTITAASPDPTLSKSVVYEMYGIYCTLHAERKRISSKD